MAVFLSQLWWACRTLPAYCLYFKLEKISFLIWSPCRLRKTRLRKEHKAWSRDTAGEKLISVSQFFFEFFHFQFMFFSKFFLCFKCLFIIKWAVAFIELYNNIFLFIIN